MNLKKTIHTLDMDYDRLPPYFTNNYSKLELWRQVSTFNTTSVGQNLPHNFYFASYFASVGVYKTENHIIEEVE